MTQTAVVFVGETLVSFELPSPDAEVLPGLSWGLVEEFPTPAYWAYQVLARRVEGRQINCRLGASLKEEVSACMLGGHGIPAMIGLAAFEHLREKGVFNMHAPSEAELLDLLSEPLSVGGRKIRYRFAKQKSKYLAEMLSRLDVEHPPVDSGRNLRDWLLSFSGIGPKTASWIARNWLDADDVAILDIHVLRAGALGGFFRRGLTVERHYLELEKAFLEFSHALSVRASELDAVIWLEMASSPRTVHGILGASDAEIKSLPPRTKKCRTNTNQATLRI